MIPHIPEPESLPTLVFEVRRDLTVFPTTDDVATALEFDTMERLSEMPTGLLLKVLYRKVLRKVSRSKDRIVFNTGGKVVGGDLESIARTYMHQQHLRIVLSEILGGSKFTKAVDIGCGWGRLSPILMEFAHDVHGFEREWHFITLSRALFPGIKFKRALSLANLNDAVNSEYDFAMTFTVLQHLDNLQAQRVISEMKRIVGDGYILLVEKVGLGPTKEYDASKFYSVGRTYATFRDWMTPWTFEKIKVVSRDGGFDPDRPFGAAYMLFRSPS